MKILMVCLGNICRSPLAEGILQHKARKAGLDWTIESAGTNGYHDGEPPHRLSQKVARLNGIDICTQRSRKITAEDFSRFDKIYAMSTDVIDEMKWIAKSRYDASKVELLMNEVKPGKNLDVPDPWYGPEPGYHDVYKMISAACDAIVEKYKKDHRPQTTDHHGKTDHGRQTTDHQGKTEHRPQTTDHQGKSDRSYLKEEPKK